jgi:replicative DNA helicase
MPAAVDIERALLGCILKEPAKLLDCLALTDDDFYLEEHRRIWRIIRALDEQGITPDLPLVGQKAAEAGVSVVYVASLADTYSLPSQVPTYIAQLKDKSRRRRVILACRKAALAIADAEDPDAVEAELVSAITDSTDSPGVVPVSDVAERTAEKVLTRTAAMGISFGIGELDAETGGMRPAELVVVAGRTGMGKSTVGLKIAFEAARLGYRVLYVTLEMPPEDLVMRLLAVKTGIGLKQIRQGTKFYKGERERIKRAAEEIGRLPLTFFFQPGVTCQVLRQVARREKLKGNCDLVVVDHAGRMRSGKKTKSDYEEVSEIAVSLKNLAIELDIPVLALYQLSRNVEHRQDKRPVLADLRGSGRIEEEADIILLLYRERYYKRDADSTLEINVAKQRNGEAGSRAKIEIPFEVLLRERQDIWTETEGEEVPF